MSDTDDTATTTVHHTFVPLDAAARREWQDTGELYLPLDLPGDAPTIVVHLEYDEKSGSDYRVDETLR